MAEEIKERINKGVKPENQILVSSSEDDDLCISQSHRRRRQLLLNPKPSLKGKKKKLVDACRDQRHFSPEVPHAKPIKPRSDIFRLKRKRPGKDLFNDQAFIVIERAAEIQFNLGSEFPSFFKLMLRSHVTHGFWLGLPVNFCRLHLPKWDTVIDLEGEDGTTYKTNFLSEKVGLSAGWRGFSIANKLVEGDAVIFHLVQPCKFKVYIVRANLSAEAVGALSLMNLDTCASEKVYACKEKDNRRCQMTNENHQMPLSQDSDPILEKDMVVAIPSLPPSTYENHQMTLSQDIHPILEKDMMVAISGFSLLTNESESCTEVVSRKDDVDDCGLPNLSDSFVELEDFKIIVNGCIMDSQLSKHFQAKYYELCRARKSYLHLRLLKGINDVLAAGIISETVNIADAIRASKLSTCLDHHATWDKALEAFELLGMEVGFLRARLNRLSGLAAGSTSEVDSKRYAEVKCERDHVEEEMRTLELKLLEMKKAIKGFENDMEALKMKAKREENMFEEEATAEW